MGKDKKGGKKRAVSDRGLAKAGATKRATDRREPATHGPNEIIEFLPDPTFVIDTEGVVQAWNRAMEELTGVPAAEIVGRGNYEYALPFWGERRTMLIDLVLLPADKLVEKYEHVERVFDTLIIDIHLPNFRGRDAYFWAKASPLYGPDGKPTGAIETIRDITERKLAEKEAERTRQELSDIFDSLPDPTMVIDTEGVVVGWNGAMEQLTGVAAADIVGRGDFDYALPFYGKRRPMLADLVFLSTEEIAEHYDHVERIFDTLIIDIHLPNFRGRDAWFWAKAHPLYDADGNLTGAIETIREISDRKTSERQAESSWRRLAEIIRFLPDATFVVDTEGKVLAWNEAMEVLTGVTAAEIVGHGDHEYALPFYGERRPILIDLTAKSPEELAERYNHVERVHDTLIVDIHIPNFRGRDAWLWAKAHPLYDDEGNQTGAIETIRDISDRKLQERLALERAEMETARRIQQSFLTEAVPQLAGFELAGRTVVAKDAGGDFFDVIPYVGADGEDGQLGVLVADVSGKGIQAALFMALSRSAVRANALVGSDPGKTVEAANDVVSRDSSEGMFVTLFYGRLSEKTRELTYVNAGENPPLLVRAGGGLERLTATGIALGARAGGKYAARSVAIGVGDVVLLYTKGITQTINRDVAMYGEERLADAVRAHAAEGAAQILVAVLDDVQAFRGDEPQADDLTLLVIKGVTKGITEW